MRPTLVAMISTGNRLSAALGPLRRGLEKLPVVRPLLPDTGVPFQLVHHDDVAAAIAAAAVGEGEPGVYNLAAPDEITTADLARELGWATVPVRRPPSPRSPLRSSARRLRPAIAEWINAFRTPVLMDCSKASRELGIAEWRSAAETLRRDDRRRARARPALAPPAPAGSVPGVIGSGEWPR